MKNQLPHLLTILCFLLVLSSCEEDIDGDIASTADGYHRAEGAFSLDAGGSSGGSSTGVNGNGEETEAGVITAGEWNDLENWSFWNSIIEKDTFSKAKSFWGFFPENRYAFSFADKNLLPIVDATVKLVSGNEIIWETKTDNFGNAELWGGMFAQQKSTVNKVNITVSGDIYEFDDFYPYNGTRKDIILPIQIEQKSTNVDLAFVVDATGSMSDELEYLKTELLDVINRIETNNTSLKLKMGTVFYRDEGDEYVTKVSNISDDKMKSIDFIKKQKADGGGDYPEAVHTALSDAVSQLSWSTEARARILFLILDAPPHHENETVKKQIQEQTQKAAEKGIKIIPITASGIDKDTEFLMRFISIATNGTYVFITNHSGIGNDHIEATVGEYEVEYLNDLMVRLIGKYTL